MKSSLIAFAAAALLAGAAHAQGMPQPPNPDLNHDGRVTLDEFHKMQAGRGSRMFDRLDANHDGKITQAELNAGAQRMQQAGRGPDGPGGARGPGGSGGGRFFAMMDANHDGVVTRGEMNAVGDRRFQMADTNHDGWLSKGEVLKMRQQMMQRGPGGGQ